MECPYKPWPLLVVLVSKPTTPLCPVANVWPLRPSPALVITWVVTWAELALPSRTAGCLPDAASATLAATPAPVAAAPSIRARRPKRPDEAACPSSVAGSISRACSGWSLMTFCLPSVRWEHAGQKLARTIPSQIRARPAGPESPRRLTA